MSYRTKWISLGVGLFAVGLVAIRVFLRETLVFNLFDSLILAIGVSSAIRVIQGFFFSAAYSVRRIPRPLSVSALVMLLDSAALFLLWAVVPFWALPMHLLLVSALSVGLVVFYSRKVVRSLNLPSVKPARRRLTASLRDLLRPLSAGLVNTLNVIEFYFLGSLAGFSAQFDYATLHIVLPLIGFAGSWAAVFYHDLKRLPISHGFVRQLLVTGVPVALLNLSMVCFWMMFCQLVVPVSTDLFWGSMRLVVLLSLFAPLHTILFAKGRLGECVLVASLVAVTAMAPVGLAVGLLGVYLYLRFGASWRRSQKGAKRYRLHLLPRGARSTVANKWCIQQVEASLGSKLESVRSGPRGLEVLLNQRPNTREMDELLYLSRGKLRPGPVESAAS